MYENDFKTVDSAKEKSQVINSVKKAQKIKKSK